MISHSKTHKSAFTDIFSVIYYTVKTLHPLNSFNGFKEEASNESMLLSDNKTHSRSTAVGYYHANDYYTSGKHADMYVVYSYTYTQANIQLKKCFV